MSAESAFDFDTFRNLFFIVVGAFVGLGWLSFGIRALNERLDRRERERQRERNQAGRDSGAISVARPRHASTGEGTFGTSGISSSDVTTIPAAGMYGMGASMAMAESGSGSQADYGSGDYGSGDSSSGDSGGGDSGGGDSGGGSGGGW